MSGQNNDLIKTSIDFNLFNETFRKFVEFLQDPWYKGRLYENKEVWERFYSSKYTIEDAFEVVEEFYNGIGFENYRDGYLKIYGIFQSLYLIQDSLNNIYNIVFKKERNTNIEKNFQVKYPKLLEVRYLRNRISGHPSKNKHFENIYISRPTISKFHFQIIKYYPENKLYKQKTDFLTINLKHQIDFQTNAMVGIITEIKEEAKSLINNHKMIHSNTKLADGFQNIRYNFEKLFNFIYGNEDFHFGKICFELIRETYNEKFNQLKERVESLEFLEHFTLNDITIQYLFNRINKYFSESIPIDKIEGEIFVGKLEELLKSFKESLNDLDENYQEMIK